MKPVIALLLAAGALSAQTPPPAPAFEVVSVRRNLSGDPNSSMRPQPGGGVQITNNTLRNIVRNVYRVEDFLIVGGPPWLATDRFDIVATGDNQNVAVEVLMERAKRLLADRFQLAAHRETREMPIYALVAARADRRIGPQLRASSIDCRPTTTGAARPTPVSPPGLPAGEQPLCGLRRRPGFVAMAGGGLEEFSLGLAGMVGRPIVDETGLSGLFDLTLLWEADLAGGQGVSLFAAIQEQLGLRLEPQRGPIDVLVIDRAEPPTEN